MASTGVTYPGLYLRGKTYWLRWTPAPNLPQERVSLETGDFVQAVEKPQH